MNSNLYLFFVINFMFISGTAIAQPNGYIKTPRGNNIEYYSFGDVPELNVLYEQQAAYIISTNHWTVEKKDGATDSYNCHSYAWHIAEGGSNNWVYGWLYSTDMMNPNKAPVDNPTNLEKYWVNNGGYIQKSTPSAYCKVFYGSKWVWSSSYLIWNNERDHSAIVTANPDYFISKWGKLPRYQHKPYECPYDSYAIIYYNINPIVQGSTSMLCNSQTRTFSESTMSNITLNYQWSNTIVGTESGGTGNNYNTVIAGSDAAGFANVSLTVTSPSGGTASTSKSFWVGVPIINNVTGPRYNQLGTYAVYSAIVDAQANVTSYNWSLRPNIFNNNFNPVNDHCNITWNRAGEYVLQVYANNICPGTSATYYYPITVAGRSYLSLSPNPASDNVQVSIIKPQNTLSASDTTSITPKLVTTSGQDLETTYTIKIYNSTGTIFYSTKKTGDTFTIPVNDLHNGTYVIEANDGKKSYTQQLVVKH